MKTVVAKTKSLVVIDLRQDLPRHENWPFGSVWSPAAQAFVRGRSAYEEVRDRPVRKVWVHHTGGSTEERGFKGPLATASYIIRDPRIVGAAVDARYGRGWPGIPYHLYVPFSPPIDPREKLATVYQCQARDLITWHTKGHNRDGLGVVCQGSFALTPGKPGTDGHPTRAQLELLAALWDEYLKPWLGLTDADLYGHADATKPTCPGGTIYDWILGRREHRTIRKLEAEEVRP